MTQPSFDNLSDIVDRCARRGPDFTWDVPVLVRRPSDAQETFSEGRSFHTRAAANVGLAEEALRRARSQTTSVTGLALGRGDDDEVELRTDDVLPLRKRTGATTFLDRIGIGRAPNADVYVPLARVSKYHAYVTWQEGALLISDARSTFGTFVDDERLEPLVPKRLVDAARVGLGPYSFRFHTADGFLNHVLRLAGVRG